jgi:hypothetical protein
MANDGRTERDLLSITTMIRCDFRISHQANLSSKGRADRLSRLSRVSRVSRVSLVTQLLLLMYYRPHHGLREVDGG